MDSATFWSCPNFPFESRESAEFSGKTRKTALQKPVSSLSGAGPRTARGSVEQCRESNGWLVGGRFFYGDSGVPMAASHGWLWLYARSPLQFPITSSKPSIIRRSGLALKVTADSLSGIETQIKNTNASEQENASLAKRNLDAITGGNTFAYVTPQNFEGTTTMFATIHSEGKNNLTGVGVSLAMVRSVDCPPGIADDSPICNIHSDGTLSIVHDIGTLRGNEDRLVPGGILIFADANYSGHYFAIIHAQNGNTLEHIWMKKSDDGKGAAYKIAAYWSATDDFKKATKIKHTDWINPVPPHSRLPEPN